MKKKEAKIQFIYVLFFFSQKKFEEYYKRFKKTGIDQNALIQELKDFRNPWYKRFHLLLFEIILFFYFSMYEKIISHLDIDEIGTNFPQVNFDFYFYIIYLNYILGII